MTQEGYDRLRSELLKLTTTTRRELAERLREARATRAPTPPRMATSWTRWMTARCSSSASASSRRAWLPRAWPRPPATTVSPRSAPAWACALVTEVLHYELVGAGEADPARWRISISSPVGEAIAGRRAGDQIEVETPRRRVRVDLVSVEPLGADLATAA